MQPRFKTRQEMMEWHNRKENRWVLNLYKWTHSLIIWALLLIPLFSYYLFFRNQVPWFLLAAPMHILMDIPTHDNNAFPVQFLTPFSTLRINGMHWSKPLVFIGNYVLIILVIYFRFFVLKKQLSEFSNQLLANQPFCFLIFTFFFSSYFLLSLVTAQRSADGLLFTFYFFYH